MNESDRKEVDSFVRGNLFAWAALALVICVLLAGFFSVATPKFEELFKGFGADVSDSTRFVIRWPHSLWVMPAIAIGLAAMGLRRASTSLAGHGRIVKALAVVTCLTIVLAAWGVRALYEPIFKLGTDL